MQEIEPEEAQIRKHIKNFTKTRTLSGQLRGMAGNVFAGAVACAITRLLYTDDIVKTTNTFALATLGSLALDVQYKQWIGKKLKELSRSHRDQFRTVFSSMREDLPDYVQKEIHSIFLSRKR